MTATDIGQAADYRVPDGAVLDGPPAGVYQPTALPVVEVVSPGDETSAKIDFYAARGVLGLDTTHPAVAVTWP